VVAVVVVIVVVVAAAAAAAHARVSGKIKLRVNAAPQVHERRQLSYRFSPGTKLAFGSCYVQFKRHALTLHLNARVGSASG
jgi:hypothetical protein